MSTRILKEPVVPKTSTVQATTAQSTIIVQPNGNIEVMSSTMPIFLGRQHDKNVLIINVDVSQLLTEELTLSRLLDLYTPYLIFKLGEKKIKLPATDSQKTNILFTITEEITNITNLNTYNIIFTLNEKGADGNVANENEYFTSAMFQGKVEPSMYDDFIKADIIEINDQPGLLKKPTIHFGWDNWNFTLSDTAAILGYNQDRYITDAAILAPSQINDPTAISYLLFYNQETRASFKHKLIDGQTFLTPQITTKASTWDISLAIIGDNQQLFSNSVPLEVLDNTLKETDLEEINHQLLKDTRNSQLVAANNPLEPTIFTLKYDGPTINLLLDKIHDSETLSLGETSSTAYAGDKGAKNRQDIETLKTTKSNATNLQNGESEQSLKTNLSTATGRYSFALGNNTKATVANTVAFGTNSKATGPNAFAHGNDTLASGRSSHAEGAQCVATKDYAHAEGNTTSALAMNSHAEGVGTKTTAPGQHAEGKYNLENPNALLIVGNGSYSERSNAFEVLEDGRAKVYGVPKENNDVVRKQELDAKQNTLTAGTNITIKDNVISAVGGDGGGGTKLYKHKINLPTQYESQAIYMVIISTRSEAYDSLGTAFFDQEATSIYLFDFIDFSEGFRYFIVGVDILKAQIFYYNGNTITTLQLTGDITSSADVVTPL